MQVTAGRVLQRYAGSVVFKTSKSLTSTDFYALLNLGVARSLLF